MSAGLPNITGHFASATGKIYSTDGAFTTDDTVKGQKSGSNNGSLDRGYLDASRSSSIYGSSSTVTPLSLSATFVIKY